MWFYLRYKTLAQVNLAIKFRWITAFLTVSLKPNNRVRGRPSWPAGRLLCCCLDFQASLLLLQTVRRFEPTQSQPVHPESNRNMTALQMSFNNTSVILFKWLLHVSELQSIKKNVLHFQKSLNLHKLKA